MPGWRSVLHQWQSDQERLVDRDYSTRTTASR